MAADVDICNLALAYLGDTSNIASINPPDGSAQASHCARFYPAARDELLERHTWGFSTLRVALASVTNPTSTWLYAYASPSNVLNYLAILDPNATDDYSIESPLSNSLVSAVARGPGVYTPQPYVVETDGSGNSIILTNQVNAVLRYTSTISDTTKFSPTFVEALARLIASKLAGPVLKGEVGRAEAKAQLEYFNVAFEKAVESDANQRRTKLVHGPQWMINR